MKRELAHLKSDVAAVGQVLHHLGLVDYLGHTSARIPGTDRLVIKPRHSRTVRGPRSIAAEDLLVVDLDGVCVDRGAGRPPSEVFIHTGIYRARPDVAAIVHTHQPLATLAGVLGVALLPILHLAATFFDREVATWPHAELVNTQALGADLAGVLGDGQFCHLQGHGVVSVAASLAQAAVGAILMEQLADANLRARQTGARPRVIPPDEIARLKTTVGPAEGRWAYYRQLAGIDE